jgi:hypothetical protein
MLGAWKPTLEVRLKASVWALPNRKLLHKQYEKDNIGQTSTVNPPFPAEKIENAPPFEALTTSLCTSCSWCVFLHPRCDGSGVIADLERKVAEATMIPEEHGEVRAIVY